MCVKPVVKDVCILSVLEGWDARDAEVVTPAPTRAVIWEENFLATEASNEKPTTTMMTTTMISTTTTTTNSSWWKDAVNHIPKILRLISTMRPPTTTTTTTLSPEARRNLPWPPANALPFSRRFPANVQPPVDAAAAQNIDGDADNGSGGSANAASIISPPSSNINADDGVVERRNDADTIPKTVDVAIATPLPQINDDPAPAVKVEPVHVVESPTSPPSLPHPRDEQPPEVEQEPIVKTEPVDANEAPIISAASSNVNVEEQDDGDIPTEEIISPPFSNVDVDELEFGFDSVVDANGFSPLTASTPLRRRSDAASSAALAPSSNNVNAEENNANDSLVDANGFSPLAASTPLRRRSDAASSAALAPPSNSVDAEESAVNSTEVTIPTSTSLPTTTSSSIAAERVLEVPTTSSSGVNQLDAVPVRAPSSMTTAQTPSLSLSTRKAAATPTTTPKSSTSKILDAIRPKAEAEVKSKSPPLIPTSASEALPTTSGPTVASVAANMGTVITWWYV